MSNQQSRPLIAPSEYERHRAAISNYRQYLDMYEKLNEQELKNHEEVERVEMMLQQRIQVGEEAKRQLELLKQTGRRPRLTNGSLAVPDLAAMAPSAPPATFTTPQASSSSAYIEEVHQEQMPPSTSSYRPYATHPMNSSNTPPLSYVPQPYLGIAQNAPQQSQQMQRNAPTSHLQVHSAMHFTPNVGQQPQIPQKFAYYRPRTQHHSQSTQNSTPAPSGYHHNFHAYSDHSMRTSSSRPNSVAALQHQSSTHQHNPPHRRAISAAKILEASSISRPESSSRPSGPTSAGTANSVKVLSRLDDALGEATARKTRSPDVPAVPPTRPVVQPSDSTGTQSTADAARNSTNAIRLLPHPLAPSNIVLQPSSSPADGQSTSSPSFPVTNQVPSPVRTPKQADKAHLARDLLRALKRPRPEVSSSSVMEPEPKRHASDLAIRPTIPSAQKSSLSVQMVQPNASTSGAVASTQTSSSNVQMVQPAVSTSNAVALTPPTAVAAPVAAPTSTQVVTPVVSSPATILHASSASSVPARLSDAPSRLGSSTLNFLVRSQINQGTSFGHQPNGSLQYVDMPGAGFGQFQPSQAIAPAKSTRVPEEKQSNAPDAQSSNISPTRQGPPVPQPEKAENPKPPPAVNLQGPYAATSSTTHPFPQKDPLFLPSPTSSPAPGSAALAVERSVAPLPSATEENREKAASNLTNVKYGSKLFFTHVEVPPLPGWVRKWKAQQNQSSKVDELNILENNIEYREESITEEPEEEDQRFDNYDEAEQQVLHEHCSILRESFCRWDKCEAVLNTPGTLLRHMKAVHRPKRISVELPWICQWAGCGYTVTTRDDYKQHIEKHAVLPLWCPFKNCTENFRTPRQCIRHKRSDHDGNAVLRRTATLSTVSSQLTASMPKIPKILPAYMTEFVRPASIPKQRHETLMISVLRRISGNVPAHLQRYNAARPMPMTPSAKDAEPPNNTPYSFLEHRSTRYSSYLSSPARSKNFQPLDSSYVTNLAKKGLVLWPNKDSNEALPEAMMEELEQIPIEEDAVEEELLNEEGFDVFGPTIAIKTPSVGGEIRGGGDGEAQ